MSFRSSTKSHFHAGHKLTIRHDLRANAIRPQLVSRLLIRGIALLFSTSCRAEQTSLYLAFVSCFSEAGSFSVSYMAYVAAYFVQSSIAGGSVWMNEHDRS